VTTEEDRDSSSLDANETAPSAFLTREALYALVWSEPMLKVGVRFGVSSSYMARVCAFLKVPRPERGYWAKLAVGKAPPVPPLPDAQPGDDLVWSRDGQRIKVAKPLPCPPSSFAKKPRRLSTPQPGEHPLIVGAKSHFEAGRLSYDSSYLKPAKKLLVDLAVTKTGLDKVLSFANRLFLAFEGRGYRVVIAPHSESFGRAEIDEHEVPGKLRGYNNLWAPWRCTVVYIGTVAIGLTIIEMSEEVEARYVNGSYVREIDYVPPKRGRGAYDHSWTTKKDFPTGRLRLQAYSPYPRAKWVKTWQETKGRDLDSQIKTIVKELERATVDIARLVEEGERKAVLERQRWEAERERWHREEAERRAVQALKESKTELRQIIAGWVESNHIERFLQDIELKAANLSEGEKLEISKRLKIARELLVSTDALDHFKKWRSPDER
jgi:hypothetical protein